MRQAIVALAAALLFGLSSAMVVGPVIYEQKDFGNIGQHQFTYSLSADCNASVITAIIYNESNKPVQDANVLLSYVDFSTPLLRNLYTDKDGIAIMKLPGQVQLMRGLFILVIQKNGFKSKEVHFDLYPCFHNGTLPPKPAPPPKPPSTMPNSTPTTLPTPPLIGAGQPPVAPPDGVNSTDNATNGTGGLPAAGGGAAGICPAALLLPCLLFFKTPKR